jgi:hypothetical protein
VTLAGDDDDVAFARFLERLRDRASAVRLHLHGSGDTGEDLGDDRLGILTARIVRGDDGHVGKARGDRAHQRTLAPVPIAAAAEHTDQPAVRQRAGLVQHRLEGTRLVRVVDQHGEGLALVDGLEAAGHSGEMLDALRDRCIVDPEQSRRGRGAEDVLHVEAAAQAGPELEAGEAEGRAARSDIDVSRVCDAELHGLLAERAQLVGELAAVWIAHVDGRGRASPVEVRLGEEPALRVEVVLHRRVEVEVVLGEVREDERAEADAEQALERRAVRGRFERAAAIAGVEHLAEGALEVDRLRRSARRRAALPADPVLDRPEEARPAAGSGEDREEEEGGRRLAVRPGDSDDLELASRMAEKRVGREGHGRPGIPDEQLGDVELERPLDDERRGAVGDRLRGEFVSVCLQPGNAHEHGSRRHAARVVGEVGDFGGSGIDCALGANGLAQKVELDGAGFYQRALVAPPSGRSRKSAICTLF